MITILLCAVIMMAAIIYWEIRENGWGLDLPTVVLSFVMGVIGSGAGMVIATILPMDLYNKHSSANIESLQDGGSMNGDLFLGCGQIDGTMKYFFYYEENGLYKLMQMDCDKAQIKYSDGKPKLISIQIYPTDAFINHFALDMDCYETTYIIEVPKGTIKNNYNLDAQ